MSNTAAETIAASAAAAEAAARARDAQDAALADAAMASGQQIDWGNDGPTGDGAPSTSAPTTSTTSNALVNGQNLGGPQNPADPVAPTTPTRRAFDRPGGDDEAGIRDDDFGLDGDVAEMMRKALEDAFPGADDSADTAGQPAPAQPDDAAAPHAAAPSDGVGGGGVDAAGNAAPVATATAPGTATPGDEFDFAKYARDYFGTDLNRQQSAELFGILNTLQTATPEQRAQIEAVLTGRHAAPGPVVAQPVTPQPVPPQMYDPATGQLLPSAPLAPAAPALPPGLPPRPTDEYQAEMYDTVVVPAFTALHQQQQQIAQQVAATTAEQQQQAVARAQASIDSAASGWRNTNRIISDGEFDALQQRVVQSGIYPGLLSFHHGDHAKATEAALEQMFWSDPNLRQRALANAASGRDPLTALPDPTTPVAQQQAVVEQGRQQLAGSVVGGGGGQVPRSAPAPRTKDERKAAMISEIAAAQGQGVLD